MIYYGIMINTLTKEIKIDTNLQDKGIIWFYQDNSIQNRKWYAEENLKTIKIKDDQHSKYEHN